MILQEHFDSRFFLFPTFPPETIDKILSFINHANKMKNRRYLGLSNVELANALRRIAVNDSNKKKVKSVVLVIYIYFNS